MNLIFSASYLSVPMVLSIIENDPNDFKIVTSNKKLLKFYLDMFESENVMEIKALSLSFSFKFPFQIVNLFLFRYREWAKFKIYKNCNVYFFFPSFAFFEAWLIKKLSKNNNIFYKSSLDLKFRAKNNSLRASVLSKLISLLYDYETTPRSKGDSIIYCTSSSYLNKIQAQNFVYNAISPNFLLTKLSKIKGLENDILFLVGGALGQNDVEEEEYEKGMRKVFNSLNDFSYSIKLHPKLDKTSLVVDNSNNKILPNYLPANIIFHKYKIVLGYFSATLFEAANAGIATISLIKLMPPKKPEVLKDKIDFYNRNLNSHKVIHFPENIQELESLLKLYCS